MSEEAVFIEQFVDRGLGNSAYLVGSHDSKTAVLIDPLRDVDRYRHAAEQLGVRLTHVLDTHIHNDFISGARELAAQVGAQVAVSAAAGLGFEHRPLVEGDSLPLGNEAVQVLATPGHTPEHLSFLLTGSAGQQPRALFSGGALIVGGAARTDLLGHDLCLPLTRQLYHSLHHKLLTLPDEVAVYPTHGAGSFCAAPASAERSSTIGYERRTNRLAQVRDEDEFVRAALAGLSSYPVYYREIRPINLRGPKVLGGLPVLAPLTPEEVRGQVSQGAVVLDVRPKEAFAAGHIPGSYGIELSAPLVTWAGWLIPFGLPLVLVADSDHQRQKAVRHLIRIAYDDFAGYLEGGIEAWAAAGFDTQAAKTISPAELRERLNSGEDITVIDVRQVSEWEAGRIPRSILIENGRLATQAALAEIPRDGPVIIACASGSRSMAGISVLARRGYTNLVQLEGGFNAWEQAGFEIDR